jgi:hypothetical protein
MFLNDRNEGGISVKMRLRSRALDKVYKRRDRYEIPDWQREEVWGTGKKQKLIDSVLRGWKLPKFYLLKTSDSPEEFEVLDGQQRLSAIWEFMDNELELSGESSTEFGGATYEDLPDKISDAFDDYEIDFDEITDATEEDQKEFFQRLQDGLPLTSSEKLNSIHSKLRDYCVRLAKHRFFTEVTTVSSKRYAYFDICAKVTALEIEGIDSGTRYDDVKKVFNEQKGFSGNSAVAKRVRSALDILHNVLPEHSTWLRNRTLVQSIVTFTCHLLRNGMDQSKHGELGQFIVRFLQELTRQVELGQEATDQEYVQFQRTINANIRTGPQTRNGLLLKKLFFSRPSFYSNELQSKDLSGTLKKQIDLSARSIRAMVLKANEVYSSVHGFDLFKPTNKTIAALSAGMNTEVASYDEYKNLIADLYFLFRESIAQRLGERIPDSFSDVNDLRTLNEHDVDHGKSGKVKKKRKDLASVFRKYSGETSPQTIDPGKWVVVQANLLAAIESDLRDLVKKGSGA